LENRQYSRPATCGLVALIEIGELVKVKWALLTRPTKVKNENLWVQLSTINLMVVAFALLLFFKF
jgi:hypothetical protein